VADDDGSLEAELADQPGDIVDESFDGVVLIRLVGLAVAAQIDADNAVLLREVGNLVAPVRAVARPAVDDSRALCLLAGRVAQAEVLNMEDCLIQQHSDVRVVQCVDDSATVALAHD